MKRGYFVLNDEGIPIPASLQEWAAAFSDEKRRRVGSIEIAKGVRVSTVFLGVDHRVLDDGPMLLFETMIFGGPFNGEMRRYSTWDDAEIGHRAIVRKVQAATKERTS